MSLCPSDVALNPYLPWLDGIVEQFIRRDPEAIAREKWSGQILHWDDDNEWQYRDMGGFLYAAAVVHTMPSSRWYGSEETRRYCFGMAQRLVDAARDDRWFHLDPRKGDGNIDRYVLLDLMCAFQVLRAEMDGELADRVLQTIRRTMRVQMEEFGRSNKDDQPYPNMDVIYALIMILGHKLTGVDACKCEADRFLNILERGQFPDGAWTYFHGTNECPVYHSGTLLTLAMLWDISRDSRVWRMIERSIPYYPRLVSLEMVPEFYTDPWWKHQWMELDTWGPDVVASLTGDGQNRWIADRLRALENEKPLSLSDVGSKYLLSWVVYSAKLWREVTPVPLDRTYLIHDANIEGPRARWDDWSWAATARVGSDTLVGAMSNRLHDGHVVALMGVTPEIEHQAEGKPDSGMGRHALGMTPPDTHGSTVITDRKAVFEAYYPMATFRGIWGAELYPTAWHCRQRWEMDEHALRGHIEVVSLKDQSSPAPLVRIRFGRFLTMEETAPGLYAYGPFQLRIGRSDFPIRQMTQTAACIYQTTQDATQLLLRSPSHDRYAQGQTFVLELDIRFVTPA
ncbi:MAG: hypothetical protein IT440_03540 [Phycisphaeraceae bacterium]|nr:hypothetical protein [Phycisphaeraceae bacterium]